MKLIDIERRPSASRKWNIHFCGAPWDEDRKIVPKGMPLRIHVNTPWFHFATALKPGSGFSRIVPFDGNYENVDWRDPRHHIETYAMWLSIRER